LSTDRELTVTQCVCHQTTFGELKASGLKTVAEIRAHFGCSTSCGLCRPYIEEMLRTGETAFALTVPAPFSDAS
jgi:NAD(P)H-nitrite reductase large subunit